MGNGWWLGWTVATILALGAFVGSVLALASGLSDLPDPAPVPQQVEWSEIETCMYECPVSRDA